MSDFGKRDTMRALVVALCRDYLRRREAILRVSVTRRVAMEYKYLNARIFDGARDAVGEQFAMRMILEIGEEVGYAKSDFDFLSEGTYKEMKTRAIRAIAARLHLSD